MNLRRAYVGSVRTVRRVPGVEWALDRMWASRRPSVRHLRTLFAVYDTDDLVTLDLPWWTYGAIAEVEAFLAEAPRRVFEYGAGASTIWLAKRAVEVVSVEHDVDYATRLEPAVASFKNVALHVVPPAHGPQPSVPSGRSGYENADFAEYVGALERIDGPFDLIVVDGRARTACLDAGLQRLSHGGMVLFDDVRRDRYGSVFERDDLQVTVYAGAKPSLPYRDATALIRPR